MNITNLRVIKININFSVNQELGLKKIIKIINVINKIMNKSLLNK